MSDWIKILLTVGFTAIVNWIFFYVFQRRHHLHLERIKNDYQLQLEGIKVTFSGIYKERADIYNTLLEKAYDLKFNIDWFTKHGEIKYEEDEKRKIIGSKVTESLRDFRRFYNIKKPYLSSSMMQNLNRYVNKLNSIFDDAYLYYFNVYKEKGIPPDAMKAVTDSIDRAIKEINQSDLLISIENDIIEEIKNHLGTIEEKKSA